MYSEERGRRCPGLGISVDYKTISKSAPGTTPATPVLEKSTKFTLLKDTRNLFEISFAVNISDDVVCDLVALPSSFWLSVNKEEQSSSISCAF